MCFKWIKSLFSNPEIPEPELPTKTALLFGINNYPGSSSDLNGCINDITDVSNKISSLFPDFEIHTFFNEQVTVMKFINSLSTAIKSLKKDDILYVHYSGHGTQLYDQNSDESDGYDEALYLYDGPLRDDEIGNVLDIIPEGAKVILVFDSCYSGTVTKAASMNQNRFHQMIGLPVRHNVNKKFAKGWKLSTLNYIVITACEDYQVCMDAYFDGRYNGAFTYYWVQSLFKGVPYINTYKTVKYLLSESEFEQTPTIEGIEEMINKEIFE